MKKQFIFILLFYWVLHFVLPFIYFLFFGFVNVYSDVQGYTGFLINTFSVFGAVLAIKYMPSYDEKREPEFSYATSFYIISLVIAAYKFISGGGYEGALSGVTHGTFISFVSLFFNVHTAFLLTICSQKNLKHIYWLVASYVLLMTGMGSRSAIVGLFLVFIILPLFTNYELAKKKLLKFGIVLALLSPLLFLYATSIRGDIDSDRIADLIVGRVSLIELSEIPLNELENNTLDRATYNTKYSALNQLKLAINAISPIDPFVYDVAPNQYYRVVFLGGYDLDILDSYWSVNLTLPVYFVLMTNMLFGVLLCVLFIVFLYWFWVKYSSNFYIFILVIVSLYDIVYFFDWVMIVQNMFSVFLTVFAMKKFNLVLNILKLRK